MAPGRILIRLTVSRDNNQEDSCQVSVSQTMPFFTEEEPKTEEEKGVFRDLANKAIAKLQAAETEVLRVLEEKGVSVEKSIISISDESEQTQSSSDGYKEKKHSHRTSRNKGKKAADKRKRRCQRSSDEESVRKVRRSSRPHAKVNYAPEWDKKTGRLLDRKKRLAEEKWALIPVKTTKSSTRKGKEKSRETKLASSDATKKKKARTEQHRHDTDEEDKSNSSTPEDDGHSSESDDQPDGRTSKTWANFSKFNNSNKGKGRPEFPLSSKRRRSGRPDHKSDKKMKAESTCRRKGRNTSPSSSDQSSDDVDMSSDKDVVEAEGSGSEGDEEQPTESEDQTGDEEDDLAGDGPKMANDSGVALTEKAFAALRSSYHA